MNSDWLAVHEAIPGTRTLNTEDIVEAVVNCGTMNIAD